MRVSRAPCLILPMRSQKNLDFFTLYELMVAAGVNMDTQSINADHSVRIMGTKLVIVIEYNNYSPFSGVQDAQPLNDGGVTYIYKVQVLNSDTSLSGLEWLTYPSERIQFLNSGVLITAVQTGLLGKFYFNILLLTLTTSATLITIAGYIVFLCATVTCGNKEYYRKAIVEDSVNFYKLKQDKKQFKDLTIEELREICRHSRLEYGGSREDLIIRLSENITDIDTIKDFRLFLTQQHEDASKKQMEKMSILQWLVDSTQKKIESLQEKIDSLETQMYYESNGDHVGLYV